MNKKAQLTVFVAIGLIMILTLGYFYYASNVELKSKQSSKSAISREPIEVRQAVQECLDVSSMESLNLLQSSNIFLARLNTTSTFYAFNKSYYPEISEVQEELEWYVDYSVSECLNKSAVFSRFNVSFENPSSEVILTSSSTIFKLKFPVIVNQDEKRYVYSEYLSEKQVRLLGIWNAVGLIVNMTKEDPNYVGIDLLFKIPYNISVIPDAGDSLIYTITDPESNLGNEKFRYNFAVYLGNQSFKKDEEFLSRTSDGDNSGLSNSEVENNE